jgi:glycosyltransferase involved in cell wall biosynthesis
MKIAYILRYFPTLSETFVYREIDGLLARGHEVVAIAMGTRADGALQDELPRVPVIRPPRGVGALRLVGPMVRARGPAWEALRRWARPKDVARAAWVFENLKGTNISRVHVHFAGEAAEWGLAIAAALGVPLSVTVHAVDLFKPRPSFATIAEAARPLVTISTANQQEILRACGVASTLVRCGVVPARYAGAETPGGERVTVLAIGRWVPKKGFDLLVDAMRGRPGARLRLVSDPPPGAVGPDVEVGALPPSAIPGALRQAHLFALPCRVAPDGDRDGIPVVLMEAMAAGLPVIAGDVGGVRELVDDEVGWLIPPGDRAALDAALTEALADPAARARKGAAGRARVVARGFTVDQQVDGLLAAWASS